jgi:hypothetical protein
MLIKSLKQHRETYYRYLASKQILLSKNNQYMSFLRKFFNFVIYLTIGPKHFSIRLLSFDLWLDLFQEGASWQPVLKILL